MSAAASTRTGSARRVPLVRCRVGRASWFVDKRDIVSTDQPARIAGPPATDPSLVLPTGEAIPIVDVASRLAETTSGPWSGAPAHAVVVRTDSGMVAFFADEVADEAMIETDRIYALPDSIGRIAGGLVVGIVDLGTSTAPLVEIGGGSVPRRRYAGRTSGAAQHVELKEASGEQRLLSIATECTDEGGRPVAFAFSEARVMDVAAASRVHALPGFARHVSGVCIWRGSLIPVVDLAARFGFGATAEYAARLVVVRGSRNVPAVGVLAPEPPATVVASEARLRLNGARGLMAPSWGVFDVAGQSVILPDILAMLSKGDLEGTFERRDARSFERSPR